MQNRAKIIIPLVVLLIVIVAIATCTGNSSIFVQWEPVAIQNSNNSVKLKVYIENSGSMDGYMRQKSEFKDAVKSYVNALDLKQKILDQIISYVHVGPNVSLDINIEFGQSGYGYDIAVVDIIINGNKAIGFLVDKN